MLNNYIERLKSLLEKENIQDSEAFVEYIEEMINDRLDAGQSQEEILNNLEEPEIVVENIKKEVGQRSTKSEKEVVNDSQADEKVYEFENIRELHMEVVTAKADIYASDIDKTIVRVIDGEDYVKVADKNGKLQIEESPLNAFSLGWPFFKNTDSSIFKRRNCQIIVKLPVKEYDKFDFENVSGSLKLSNIYFDKATFETVSGTLNIDSARFNKSDLEAVSGSIILNDVISKQSFKAEIVSGNVQVNNIESDYIDIEAVSGNIDLNILGNRQDYRIDIEKIMKEEHYNENGNKRLKIESVSGRINYQFTY